MQKWCPEPFTPDDPGELAAAATADDSFAYVGPTGDAQVEDRTRVFRSESGFASPENLMSQLSQQERALVFELAEHDVARNYEQRERDLRAELETAHAEALARTRDETRAWAEGFGAQHAAALRDIAAAGARLAVTLAEKVIRARIDQDRDVLVRTLETALFATGAGEALIVTVNPDDAVWLHERTDLCERLHIGEIVADRRIDCGGCRIVCDGRELDATLGGQLDNLSEVITEWITTAGGPPPAEDEHDPAVD